MTILWHQFPYEIIFLNRYKFPVVVEYEVPPFTINMVFIDFESFCSDPQEFKAI